MAERQAINSVVQGSAADLIKMAMLNIHRRLEAEKRPSRMLLQVHDELVFETPIDAVESEAADDPAGDGRSDETECAAEGGSGVGEELARSEIGNSEF
jgi:hypothetical protein